MLAPPLHQPICVSNSEYQRWQLRLRPSDPSRATSRAHQARTYLSSPDRAKPNWAFRGSRARARSFHRLLPPLRNPRSRGFVATFCVTTLNRRRSESSDSYDLPDRVGHVYKSDTLVTQTGFHHHAWPPIHHATALRFCKNKPTLRFDPGCSLLSIRSHSRHYHTEHAIAVDFCRRLKQHVNRWTMQRTKRSGIKVCNDR